MNDLLRNQIKDRILNNLDVSEEEFLQWETNDYLADSTLVAKFWDEIEKAPAIKIVGDYDVDGICATYIIATAIQKTLQKQVSVRIPHRFSEGYGFNQSIADEIREKNVPGTLIITVDNGITAGEILEELEKDGYPVIITDHHLLIDKPIPKVTMVIDPVVNAQDALCGDYWCGAGVVLKLTEQYIKEDQRVDLEAFAAIATIADCVNLREGNWRLVHKALKDFRQGKVPPQIAILSGMLGQNIEFCTEDTFAYYLGPAINSVGRLFDNGGTKVLSYFISPNLDKAREIVNTNTERKQLRDDQYALVLEKIYATGADKHCPIWVQMPNLHEGIIGILAGNLVEEFGVPAIVLSELGDGILKGSARTTEDIDILKYLHNCGAEFISLGGHSGAAGLKMAQAEFEKAKMTQLPKPSTAMSNVHYFSIEAEDIPEIKEELEKYVPFGNGNPQILFAVDIDTNVDNASFLGADKNHLVIEDVAKKWKITKFFFYPNSLEDNERFYIIGNIGPQAYRGVETPSLSGKMVIDSISGRGKGDWEK